MRRIRLGQKVEIEFKNTALSSVKINCSVLKAEPDRLTVNFPPSELSYANELFEGREILASVFTNSGILVFDTLILEGLNEQNQNRLEIALNDEFTCIQRRKYVRAWFEAIVTVKFKDEDREVVQEYIGTTKDIGGGGIRFYTNDPIEHGVDVNFEISLHYDEPSISGDGRIMKNEFLADNEYVIIFGNINEYSRSKLIKKCYEQEASELKELEAQSKNG